MLVSQLESLLNEAVAGIFSADVSAAIEHPSSASYGDYTTNIAMILGKKLSKNPMEVAEKIRLALSAERLAQIGIEKVEVVKPGFINFWLSQDVLLNQLEKKTIQAAPQFTSSLKDKRIMVEFAHPNTHKEMHIGHMRTLITGEAISRLLAAAGAKVFRANYQGDIGPHVAKALYGIEVLMAERKLTIDAIEKWSNKDKAHFLGEGYVRGNKDYEASKEQIDTLNTKLYEHNSALMPLYERTRRWSLDYYEEFYERFYTKFDQLFFESEVAASGKKIVEEHVGKVFVKENGAIIFPGEKYALHTRVFITQAGNPTYEGKEMGNAYAEYKAFPFDLKMHIVASEQAGYFQVVFKALDLIDPEKFEGKEHHLSMGMVTLTDRKMSSRTGDILTVDWLIDQVKAKVEELAKEGKITAEKIDPDQSRLNRDQIGVDDTVEMITIGAIKYSVLKGSTGANAAFDIEKSVALDGNSGPYLQYTYARTCSVLAKSGARSAERKEENAKHLALSAELEVEETQLLRKLYQFESIVVAAATEYAPNHLATYLYELAQLFNFFYQKHKVIGSEQEQFRLALTALAGSTLKQGLNLLGINAPEKM